MARRRLSLHARIPAYSRPRGSWRRKIHDAVAQQQRKHGVRYRDDDQLEIEARVYMGETPLGFHDVDNLLKDIMDALQGRMGGTSIRPIIANDVQVHKATIEKLGLPKQSQGMSHLFIRKYRPKFG